MTPIAIPAAARTALLAAALLGLCAGAAQARSFDAKALARYDLSYAQCEQQYEAMRGQRDQAYLNLYRVKPDPQAIAQLEAIRRGAAYRAERRKAMAADVGSGARADANARTSTATRTSTSTGMGTGAGNHAGAASGGATASSTTPLPKKLAQQCEGLWAENRKVQALPK